MPTRRVQPSDSYLNLSVSTQPTPSGTKPSPSLPSITRSASPSGFSGFFSRPTKWFMRSGSNPRLPAQEPRLSTSSITSQRKPNISGPTDPRPIILPAEPLDNITKLGGGTGPASRSVLDLSLGRTSSDLNSFDAPSGGLGDLRSISRKAWSRSADNLSTLPSPKLSRLDTSFSDEQKTKIEQYRSGNSPGSPLSAHSNYPFPTITTSPSTPTTSQRPAPLPQHAHSRSVSHTPNAVPNALLVPPSPQQHAPPRKRSTDFDRMKEKSTGAVRGAFPFHFGAGNGSSTKATTPPAVSTPEIREPEEVASAEDSKRASQIVHRSGFVNRLQIFSTSPSQLSSSKNWKPFKLVLKGSKLYFYKPPSDRSAAIKQLFPSGLVTVLEDAMEQEENGDVLDVAGKRTNRDDAKKKRTFWGRRPHPELVITDGKIVKGAFEAFVHEAVFGTTFRAQGSPTLSNPFEGSTLSWKRFASSVLLCLPQVIDRCKFEIEFLRCASYLVSGADEVSQEAERTRVTWLATEYIGFHGPPADAVGWETFRSETIPSFRTANAILPSPSSTDVVFDFSPDLGTFSPRPADGDKLPTFASAFALSPSPPKPLASPVRSPKSTARARLWSLLEHEGFTRDVLLRLDPDSIVRSLLLYHRSLLESESSVLSANVILDDESDSPLTEFFGCDEKSHWLTRLIVGQILGPSTVSSLRDDAAGVDDRSTRSSPTHTRSEVISKWAKIGELSRQAGDECTWRTVMAALCSKPIARLEKAWKRVDNQAILVVRSWVYPAVGGERLAVKEPRTTPWGADARQRAISLLAKAHDGKGSEWNVLPMEDIKEAYDKAKSSFSSYTKKLHLDPSDEDDMARLTKLWADSSKALPPKSANIDQYMSLSLAAEPRMKGRFAPYYWTRQTSSQGLQALIPLAFVEALPTVSLVDRSQITRSKKVSLESDTALAKNDVHTSRIMQLKYSIDSKGVINSDGTSDSLRPNSGREFGGMVLPVFDGELLLLVQPGAEIASRPVSTIEVPDPTPSRAPSIRVSSAAARLDRKASRARRSSLPSLSQRTSMITTEPSAEPPLRVVVQAGTLDALVHLLAHGLNGVTVSVADDNGEMALRDGNTRSVKVDRGEFATVWWNVFRSFVTPLVLFELLRKQFLSKSTSRSSISTLDLQQAIRSRLDVIETMSEWIHKGGGAQDALDDVELFTSISTFLSNSADHVLPPSLPQPDELSKSWEALESARKSLLESFKSQTMRPQMRSSPIRGSAPGGASHNFGTGIPSIDEISPEELVNNLDAMAGAAFRNVVQEDLFVVSDLLEVQTADRAGWFLPREPTIASDELEIQTMYSHIMDVEPTSLTGGLTSDSFYRLLPPGIRSLIRAHNILRKWTISKIVAQNLGLKARQARLELFLQAIEVCRLRSSDQQASDLSVADFPCLRSSVESILTSALLSAESRLHHRAWQGVAWARGVHADSLASILTQRCIKSTESQERLTVDPAWLLERMLEVITLPDVLDSSSETPVSLVNFDKRRHICNIVINSSSFTAPRSSQQRRELDRCDFERLNNIEHDVADLYLDLRSIKEDAQREAFTLGQPSTPNNRRGFRPFQRLVAAQQEKIKRDRYLRERFIKEKRLEQQKQDRREEDINRAMDARKSVFTPHKQHRSKRSMSAFFRVMRPISTALSSDSIGISSHKRSAAELDFVPTQKPALALSLVDARIAQFTNNERSFTFQLDTEDGGHYLLQATSKAEMNKWISTIHNTVHSYAQRRLTYIGESPKPQLSDHIHSRPRTASQDPTAVFGVDLEFLLKREAGEAEVTPGTVPRVFDLCLTEIESRGLNEVGIYRIAGATTEVVALRDALNKGKESIDPSTDIHAVGDCVKFWLRTLPEPIFPESYYHSIIDATNTPELEGRLSKIRDVVHSLPPAHYYLLKRLIEHLDRVADFEDKNHMTPQNLSVVFSPNLLRAPFDNYGVILKNMGTTQVLTKALITHLHVIFNETDADLDNDEDEDEDVDDADGTLDEAIGADANGDRDDLIPEPESLSRGDEAQADSSDLPSFKNI